MADIDAAYIDREQTRAKHFILRGYLQELAFKVLHSYDLAFVDGFSGPWQSDTTDFSDTSFMIAIDVLKEAQRVVAHNTGKMRKVRCFFVERNTKSYAKLDNAVRSYNYSDGSFSVRTFNGRFEDGVDEIQQFIGGSFPLIFIDPKGWTGYPFSKIRPLFQKNKCEVLINFMYSFASRFLQHPDQKIIDSLNPILGGPSWHDRLDASLPIGLAVEKLFRETLRREGDFKHVVSTCIDKSTEDRPHFFLAYGTKSIAGLKAFRETEYKALKEHAKQRAVAKIRKRDRRVGSTDMFSDLSARDGEESFESIVMLHKERARQRLMEVLASSEPQSFNQIVGILLEEFIIRETDAKNICVSLAKEGRIQKTWGGGNRKPSDETLIVLGES